MSDTSATPAPCPERGCACARLGRRGFVRLLGGGLLVGAGLPAWAREGVDVGPPSSLSMLVP
ncbi:MAG: hypothetical protein ACXWCN_05825, partial [Caldimonas sp.]